MEEDLNNSATSEKMKTILPLAEKARNLTRVIYAEIENVKKQVKDDKSVKTFLSNDSASALYKKIEKYTADVKSIDEKIKHQFVSYSVVPTADNLTVTLSEKEFINTFFDTKSSLETITSLTSLQNSCLVFENRVINYCRNQVGMFIEDYDVYSAIIGQDKSGVMNGETLEITAGMGSFTRVNIPEISIDGKLVELNESGIGIKRIKVKGKPGRYSIPVKIQYTDQDGMKQTLIKNVEYQILAGCN